MSKYFVVNFPIKIFAKDKKVVDALAGSDGVLNIEDRMRDVKQRYGYYPQEKWNSNIRLKNYFEKKTRNNIYKTVNKS